MLLQDQAVLAMVDVQGNLAQLMHERESLFTNLQRMVRGAQTLELPILWAEQNPRGLGPTALSKDGSLRRPCQTGGLRRFALLGGRFVGENALLRFYVLHCVILPLAAALLVAEIIIFVRDFYSPQAYLLFSLPVNGKDVVGSRLGGFICWSKSQTLSFDWA